MTCHCDAQFKGSFKSHSRVCSRVNPAEICGSSRVSRVACNPVRSMCAHARAHVHEYDLHQSLKSLTPLYLVGESAVVTRAYISPQVQGTFKGCGDLFKGVVNRLADRFAADHAGRLCFCRTQRRWFIREGSAWICDKRQLSFDLARISVREANMGARYGSAAVTQKVLRRASFDRRLQCEGWCRMAAAGGMAPSTPRGGSKSQGGAAPRTTHALTWRFFNRAAEFQRCRHALRAAVTAIFPHSIVAQPSGRLRVQRAAEAIGEHPPVCMSHRLKRALVPTINFRRCLGGEIAHR